MKTPGQIEVYWKWRAKGATQAYAAAKAGFSISTAKTLERQARVAPEWSPQNEVGTGMTPAKRLRAIAEAKLEGPIPLNRLCPEAKRALEDFDYFRRRYFGRISTPWQLKAIAQLVELLESGNREYVDLNECPGVGKSTLLSDFKCWLICRNRGIRMLTGSATQSLARKSLKRVMRNLERMAPLRGDSRMVALGLELNAVTTLAHDFGRFKPTDNEVWNRDSFIVMQHDGMAIEDKEATLTAYGIDTEFTGDRFNYVEWDDLVSPSSVESPTYRSELESIYVKTCEPRVEPEGLLVLCGQRLFADDLHHFVQQLVMPPEDEDDDDEDVDTNAAVEMREAAMRGDRSYMKYRHIVYKSHYPELCSEGSHKKTAPAYLEGGCLLDPRRQPYRDLVAAQANNPAEFALVFQQEDADPADALAQRGWVYGDENHLGCVDYDRGHWEIPEDIPAYESVVFACADPSPSMYWSVQCWLWHEPSKRLVMLCHARTKMKMPEMLDRTASGVFTGLMEEWQELSHKMGFPIMAWVVEANAAQRWMLQQSLFRDWLLQRGVELIPHTTGMNKLDPNYGVWSLRTPWRLGRVRLPMQAGDAFNASTKLIEEVLVYDHGRTDDCVMAMWMGFVNLDKISLPEESNVEIDRPAWVLAEAF